MTSQPSRNDQAIASGQNDHAHAKFYSPFKTASYYGQNAAASAAASNVRDTDDEGRLRYHDPSYQKQMQKQQEELRGKDAHRWDKFNAGDVDVGAEAAANHDNVAKKGLNAFRSWWNGNPSASSGNKEFAKAEVNVADRAQDHDSSDQYQQARNLAEADQQSSHSLFGGIKGSLRDKLQDIDQSGGKAIHQEIDDVNLRNGPTGTRQFDSDVTPLNPYVSGNKSSIIGAFGNSRDESALMPSAQLRKSALICKTDLDAFERCAKKYDYNDDRCKDAWDAFVHCNDSIPTKL